MNDASDSKADCYSAQERAGMVRYQQFKDWLLEPMLAAMTRCRISADFVTGVSTIAGLAFCPLYFWSAPWAYACLAVHLLLDGLDGPLARHSGSASRSGSFTDTVGDQLVVIATTVTWMYAKTISQPGIDIISGSVYLSLYTVVVAFAVVRNSMGIPYTWLLRPRNFVYAWFLLESFVLIDTQFAGSVVYFIWFFNAILAVKFVTGFLSIRAQL